MSGSMFAGKKPRTAITGISARIHISRMSMDMRRGMRVAAMMAVIKIRREPSLRSRLVQLPDDRSRIEWIILAVWADPKISHRLRRA